MEMELIDKCAICFEDLADKETARPDVCDHTFCLQCLQTWGKIGSFCPIDRKRFKKIVNLSTSIQIPVKPKKRKKQQVLYDVSSHCEVCRKVRENDTLLLCDCCDLAYHLVCLTPPLSKVPPGVWNCPVCVAVDERLKSKKGITKDVEDIVRNHTYLGLSTSSESSSSETNRSNNQSSNSEIHTIFSKPKTRLRDKDRGISNGRKKSFPDRETVRDVSTESIAKLHSLRPRHQIEKKLLVDWSDSSDDCNDSSNSTITLRNHSKKFTRVRSLRPRKRILYDNSYDSSDTSYGYSRIDGQEISLEKTNTSAEQSNNLNIASPESDDFSAVTSTAGENNGFISETFPVTCTTDKAIPETTVVSPEQVLPGTTFVSPEQVLPGATIVSPEQLLSGPTVVSPETHGYEINDIMNSNICIITSACSLKNCGDANFKVIEGTEVAADACASILSSSISESQTFEDDDEISVIATVVKDPSAFKPIAKEKFKNIPNLSNEFASDHCSEDDLPNLDFMASDLKDDKPNIQKVTSSKLFAHGKVKPVFSVFEKLEAEDLAQKKYSELNKAVKKIHPTKKDSAVLVRKELSDSFQLCSKNTTEMNRGTFSKANALSQELRAIEKEKWKSHHLRSENVRRLSHKLQCCKSYGKNHYKSSDVVHIGKYFCQKKYSDNYKELSSISKSLRQKRTWGEKDIVILNNLKRNIKGCSKDPKLVNSCNMQYSGIPNHPSSSKASKVGKYLYPEIISFEKEGLLNLQKAQPALLRATLCLSNLKHLNVQKDGLISLNWQK